VLATCALAQTTLNGAAQPFPYPIYSKWFNEYHNLHSNIQINYQSIGSGGGIRQVQAGTVDFGRSDGPMAMSRLPNQGQGTALPTVLGAVVRRTHSRRERRGEVPPRAGDSIWARSPSGTMENYQVIRGEFSDRTLRRSPLRWHAGQLTSSLTIL